MKCPIESRETEILVAYSSGKMETERAPQVAVHLESCAACREFVQAQKAVWDSLDVWEPAPLSADFNRRLYRQMEQPASWFDRLLTAFRRTGFHQAIPIGASAALILMAGLLLRQHQTQSAVAHQDAAIIEAIQPDELDNALSEMEALSQLSRPVRSDSTDSKM